MGFSQPGVLSTMNSQMGALNCGSQLGSQLRPLDLGFPQLGFSIWGSLSLGLLIGGFLNWVSLVWGSQSGVLNWGFSIWASLNWESSKPEALKSGFSQLGDLSTGDSLNWRVLNRGLSTEDSQLWVFTKGFF